MKTYLFEEANNLLNEGQDLEPTKPALWAKTRKLYEFQSEDKHIEFYEKLGGRWIAIEEELVTETTKVPAKKQAAVPRTRIKNEAVGPIFGITEEDHDIVRSIREYDPASYRRMRNWD
jgi:hypothetical protein